MAIILTLTGTLTAAQLPIAIGVVREDGALIPLITMLGDKHQPLLEEDVVFTPAAQALPNSWEFWRNGDRRPITIATTVRRIVESHCSEQEVWTTTLKAAATPKDAAAINKIGIATQGPVTVEFPERITSQMDQSSRQASAIIVSTTNLNETRFIRENVDDQVAQIPSTVRARTNVQIEKLIRRRTQRGAIYYFEATKSYGEFVGTLTTGWVMLSSTGNNTFGVAVGPSSGEAGAVTHDVLGVVHYGASELWVLQRNGYESESYVVYQWPKGQELVELFGGGC